MKVLVLFATVVALALTASVKVPKHPKYEPATPDQQYMHKTILQLFRKVYQPNYYPEHEKVGSSYNLEGSTQYYTHPNYVIEYLQHYKNGCLPKGQVFSIFYDQHQKEAIAFFRVLYSAVDFDTFYKTACWGRMHLNEGLYIYALSVALAHRPDTWQLELPPIYEMYPFYFYNVESLKKVHQYFFKGDYTKYFKPTGERQMPYYYGKGQYPYSYGQSQKYQGQDEQYRGYPQNQYEKNQYPQQYQQYQNQYQQYPQQYQQYPQQYQQYPQQYQQYPQQYQQYQPQTGQYQQQDAYRSYPYTYGQYPYYKRQYPGQYEQYQYKQQSSNLEQYLGQMYDAGEYQNRQSEYYPRSYPVNYKSYPYRYGQDPYDSRYQGQYQYRNEQYPYQQYDYEEYPYYRSQYPGQYYNRSYPYAIRQQYLYGRSPYSYEQGQYQYGKTPYIYEGAQDVRIPYLNDKTQYPYAKTYQRSEYPYQKTEYPYQKTEYPYQRTEYPYQYEKPNPQEPSINYPYQRTEYPYEKVYPQERKYESIKSSYPDWLNQLLYAVDSQSRPEKYYPQERENAFDGITIDYEHNTENPLFYFTEDIGLNAFYYYYHIYFPHWMTNEEIIYKTEFRGEQYYYFHQQLLARYNLELISLGLPAIELLNWDGFIRQGFESQLGYPNGLLFPDRPENVPITPRLELSLQCYDNLTMSLTNIKEYESRILQAIDSGYVLTRDGKYVSIFHPRGFEVLGNLIQANPESPNARYYGNIQVLARYVLGYSKYPVDQYNIAPSVLEHFETSIRDPAFYQLYKRVIYYFQRYKQYLPKYTQDELYLPGVKIDDVGFDKLVTYFDYFYSDITNGLLGPMKDPEFQDTPILVKQRRLNHQPFNYYLKVNSEKPYEAVIRVFLGPKYDQYGKPYSINENRLNFVEFDRFTYTLVPGVNTIERNSRQSFFAPDRTSYKELLMQVFNVHTPMYETTPKQVPWAMPQRMLLPRGSKEGQTFQVYFIITPQQGGSQKMPKYSKYTPKHVVPKYTPTLYWDNKLDTMPYGYPFDRPIEEASFFVPNSFFKDVVIYHEEQ